MEAIQEIVNAPPGDGITCLKFAPKTNHLIVSSWDSTTRYYDVSQNVPKATFNFKAACLTCCFQDESVAFGGGLDKEVRKLELERGTESSIGMHQSAVSCIGFSNDSGLLFSGSWDGNFISWDVRSFSKASTVPVSGKIFSLSISITQKVVIATGGNGTNNILIYDIRNLSKPIQDRESPLRHQTRKVACFTDGYGYAVGSTEGRVAIEYFEMDADSQSLKYAFKCHRKADVAYPVNAIAYHPVYGEIASRILRCSKLTVIKLLGTFATGGGDGIVNIWDGAHKKRLQQLPPYPTSISSLDFKYVQSLMTNLFFNKTSILNLMQNNVSLLISIHSFFGSYDGTLLAISSSYTFEEGDIPHPDDNIFVRKVQDIDVRPRPKVA